MSAFDCTPVIIDSTRVRLANGPVSGRPKNNLWHTSYVLLHGGSFQNISLIVVCDGISALFFSCFWDDCSSESSVSSGNSCRLTLSLGSPRDLLLLARVLSLDSRTLGGPDLSLETLGGVL